MSEQTLEQRLENALNNKGFCTPLKASAGEKTEFVSDFTKEQIKDFAQKKSNSITYSTKNVDYVLEMSYQEKEGQTNAYVNKITATNKEHNVSVISPIGSKNAEGIGEAHFTKTQFEKLLDIDPELKVGKTIFKENVSYYNKETNLSSKPQNFHYQIAPKKEKVGEEYKVVDEKLALRPFGENYNLNIPVQIQGHSFKDYEIKALLNGGTVKAELTNKEGNKYNAELWLNAFEHKVQMQFPKKEQAVTNVQKNNTTQNVPNEKAATVNATTEDLDDNTKTKLNMAAAVPDKEYQKKNENNNLGSEKNFTPDMGMGKGTNSRANFSAAAKAEVAESFKEKTGENIIVETKKRSRGVKV